MFFMHSHEFRTNGCHARCKRGFGIIEVMIAALVLGILYAAVSNLQKGNRDALLRIRGRDGATEVAQNIIDSLSTLGLASFSDEMLTSDGYLAKKAANGSLQKDEGGNNVKAVINRTLKWRGQPGSLSNNEIEVEYEAEVKVSPDAAYRAGATSLLRSGADSVKHVFAKRLDVTVSWPFRNSRQSISVSGVVR